MVVVVVVVVVVFFGLLLICLKHRAQFVDCFRCVGCGWDGALREVCRAGMAR